MKSLAGGVVTIVFSFGLLFTLATPQSTHALGVGDIIKSSESEVGALISFIVSIFNHDPAAQPAAVAAAVTDPTPSPTPVISTTEVPPAPSISTTTIITNQPIIRQTIIENPPTNTSVLSNRLNALIQIVGNLASILPAFSAQGQSEAVADFPQSIGGDGNPEAIGAGAAINQLSNVTIANPTFTNFSTSQVPEGSNLYYSDNRVASYITASTSIPSAVGTLGSVLAWNGSRWASTATSSLGILGGSSQWTTAGSNISYTTGNIGIGTTSPSALFTIDSTSTTGSILRLSNASSGGHVFDLLSTGSGSTGGAGRLDIFDSTAGLVRLSIAANGNVGIGTSTPSGNLVINGTSGQNLLEIATSTNQNIFSVNQNGVVGIGATSSSALLAVGGPIGIYSSVQSQSFTLSDRTAVISLPVPTFYPATSQPNGLIAVDIIPRGTPTESPNNGYAWNDICDTDIINGSGPFDCLHLGIGSVTYIGSYSYSSDTAKPIAFRIGADTGTPTEVMRLLANGSIGIGTTTPYSRLEVYGPDAASTSAFAVVNSASTTEFTVYDTGNATLAGSLVQNSDIRLKTNIQSLDATSSLSLINHLNPVTFNWIDPNKGSVPQLGFIAQQIQGVFPNLVSTTSPTALTPDGTLSLNYIDLISPIVSAIQAISAEITSIENTIAGFAQSFTTHQLCLSDTNGTSCYTRSQLNTALSVANQVSSPTAPSPKEPSDATDTPPVIEINGANPATIQVGATYNDLGATITGPQADLNLGINTFVNGIAASSVQIDTSQAATDTIDYVVTDGEGNASTSTRTVVIQAPIIQANDASSSNATSTQE